MNLHNRQYLLNKVLEVAHACVDEKKKGWRVRMGDFHDAMDDLGFDGKDVREALGFLQQRAYVITFIGEDGHVAGISLVPQRYRCWQCDMLLDMQDETEDHIQDCMKRQQKFQRNRKLV
jgi:hypothetical protein